MKADLETRIADALGSKLSSQALAALVEEVTAADGEAKRASAAATERSLDPKTLPADVTKARKEAEDCDFRRRRFERALSELKGLHEAALAQEREDERKRERNAALEERDQLAVDLIEYEELASKISGLLARLQASNARVGDFHSAEISARGADERWPVMVDETLPKLLDAVRLPKFKRDGTNHGYLWPRT